jgi:transcriptional regulator with XRE-family HTH domain
MFTNFPTTQDDSFAGAALTARRRALDLNQEELAFNIAASQTTVSDLERGRRSLLALGLKTITALARALKWSLPELEKATGVDFGLKDVWDDGGDWGKTRLIVPRFTKNGLQTQQIVEIPYPIAEISAPQNLFVYRIEQFTVSHFHPDTDAVFDSQGIPTPNQPVLVKKEGIIFVAWFLTLEMVETISPFKKGWYIFVTPDEILGSFVAGDPDPKIFWKNPK